MPTANIFAKAGTSGEWKEESGTLAGFFAKETVEPATPSAAVNWMKSGTGEKKLKVTEWDLSKGEGKTLAEALEAGGKVTAVTLHVSMKQDAIAGEAIVMSLGAASSGSLFMGGVQEWHTLAGTEVASLTKSTLEKLEAVLAHSTAKQTDAYGIYLSVTYTEGSGTTKKEFAATLTGAGRVSRNTQRAMPAALTATAGFPRGILTSFKATLAATGLLGRTTQRSFSGTVTSAGSFVVGRLAKLLTATLAPGAALGAKTSRGMTATLTATGASSRNTARGFPASVTPSAAFGRQTMRQFAASISSKGSFITTEVGRFVKVFTAAITGTGGLSRNTSRAMPASSTPSGVLGRSSSRAMRGSITPAGALNRKSILAFTGSLASSGRLGRAAAAVLRAALEPSGVIQRSASRTFTAVLPSSGVLGRLSTKRFTASTAPTASLQRDTAKSFPAAIAPAATLKRAIRLTLGSILGLAGKFSRGRPKTQPQKVPTRAVFAANKTGSTFRSRLTRGISRSR